MWQKKQQSLVKGKRVWVHQWSAARQITHSFSTHRFYTVESFCRAWMIGKSCAFWNTSSIVQDENSVGIYFLKLHCHRKKYLKKIFFRMYWGMRLCIALFFLWYCCLWCLHKPHVFLDLQFVWELPLFLRGHPYIT